MSGKSTRLPREPWVLAAQPEPEGSDRQFASTLGHGMAVLTCFGPQDKDLGNAEIAARTGLTRPTVSRLAFTLTRLGFLAYARGKGKYRLAPGILTLGYPLLANLTFRHVAHPYMQRLAEQARGNVSLSMRSGLNMTFVETVRSAASFEQMPDVGKTFPLHVGATGRAYLAGCSQPERAFLVQQLAAGQEKRAWKYYEVTLEEELKRYKDHGYCRTTDSRSGYVGLAVPMLSLHSEIVVINCGVPAFELKSGIDEDEVAMRLVSLARNLDVAAGNRR